MKLSWLSCYSSHCIFVTIWALFVPVDLSVAHCFLVSIFFSSQGTIFLLCGSWLQFLYIVCCWTSLLYLLLYLFLFHEFHLYCWQFVGHLCSYIIFIVAPSWLHVASLDMMRSLPPWWLSSIFLSVLVNTFLVISNFHCLFLFCNLKMV